MTSTTARPASVIALFSAQQADGSFTELYDLAVAVPPLPRSVVCAVHNALAAYLGETNALAGVYGFEFDGEFRQDRWNGTEFPGCGCRAGVDPECGMFACWGIPADRQASK